MALTPIPGFCGGNYASRIRGVSVQRTVNMHVERNQDPASKTPYSLVTRPGKKLFKELPTSPVQGMWANKYRVFIASGGAVYELFQDKSVKLYGQIAVGTNPALMKVNGNQLMITSAGNAYVSDGVTLYQPIINYASGTINIAGTAVTWATGDKFDNVTVGDLFMVGVSLQKVSAKADNTHLTLQAAPPPPALQPVAYQAGTSLLYGATLEFIDSYFIVGVPNSRQFRISNLKNGAKWDQLDFAEKSGSVDNIACVKSLYGQLALIGDTDSTELWVDSGNVNFPFARISGRGINVGTDAPWSVAKLPDGSLCWLLSSEQGTDQIVRTVGGEPTPISNRGIEEILRSMIVTDDAVGSTFIENGCWYYRIDFPTANVTLEYNATENFWNEAGLATAVDEVYTADHGRFRVHVTWPNTNKRVMLCGDYMSGKIWEISPSFRDDDGVDFPVMRIGPTINTNLERTATHKFALDCELGTVDPTLKGRDSKPLIPTVNMAYSDDGGNNWNEGGAAALGRAGEYEGIYLTDQEKFDATANSQTNPAPFEALPVWTQDGASRIGKTFKVKSTGKQLRAIHAGLIEMAK